MFEGVYLPLICHGRQETSNLVTKSKPLKWLIWGLLSAWKLGWQGARGAIHCLQGAVKPCLGAYVRQHMQLEASISPEHVTLGHIHQEIPPETSCSGIEPSVWQKILWCKENHSLLLKCFITLIEYPYQKAQFEKISTCPLCVILCQNHRTSLLKNHWNDWFGVYYQPGNWCIRWQIDPPNCSWSTEKPCFGVIIW